MQMVVVFSRFLFLGALIAVVLGFGAGDALAHTSLDAEPAVELAETDHELDAHCHGAVECVLTLFVETLKEKVVDPAPKGGQNTFPEDSLVGISLGRDPPIPILFR